MKEDRRAFLKKIGLGSSVIAAPMAAVAISLTNEPPKPLPRATPGKEIDRDDWNAVIDRLNRLA
jgi:hypothetical protein